MKDSKTQTQAAKNHADTLCLYGVSENNLKNLTVKLPHDQLTVITGVSGSGKSTLAFDTIYAEGARRYIETFSPYTRQFLDRLKRPELEAISGVRPALALEQRNKVTSSRSTVGTITEINDYLKLIWANTSVLHCETCAKPIVRESPQRAAEAIIEAALEGDFPLALLTFALKLSGEATLEALASTMQAEGFLRFFSPASQTVKNFAELTEEHLPKYPEDLLVVVDRIKLDMETAARTCKETQYSRNPILERLRTAVSQAYTFGHGKAQAVLLKPGSSSKVMNFSEALYCATCSKHYPEPKPSLFSFNNPLGACRTCRGFGNILSIDPQKCIPDPSKSLEARAIACWSTPATAHEAKKLRRFCQERGISTDVAWSELKKSEQDLILYGPPERGPYKGIIPWFKKLERKRHKMHVRVYLSRFRTEVLCPDCHGFRLQPDALRFTIRGKTLPELWHIPISALRPFFHSLLKDTSKDEATLTAVEETLSRLQYLSDIGLNYLTLDRQSKTLSGGEAQRVNLTSILGSRLVHTMLVLDEPTIGLHPKDTARLLESCRSLRDRGNSLFVVEHDLEVIRAADNVLDLGPEAGSAGGEIVFFGSPQALEQCKESLTGEYLREPLSRRRENFGQRKSEKHLLTGPAVIIRGASAHNLKHIDVRIPLRAFVVLSGVSGSGKSTLVNSCLYEPYRKLREGANSKSLFSDKNTPLLGIEGLADLDDILLVDQSPIGKTPRSNPATYTKAWDYIRLLLAQTSEAEKLGLNKSSFSFNVDGGRCPVCKGAGEIRVEMQFLADVFLPCESCGGKRFQQSVLGPRCYGRNVVDFLQMTLTEAELLFSSSGSGEIEKRICQALQPLLNLGLGYLRLGQPLNTLSGGEAQRLKLASYLRECAKKHCLFILDEPTTGLHPHNIQALLQTFGRILDQGHSLLCIEHNLDVLSQADWILDLGPEGGEQGGRLIAEGPPDELIASTEAKKRSATVAMLAEYRLGRTKAYSSSASFGSSRKKTKSSVSPKLNAAIQISGARHHNLQNLSVDIPYNKVTVLTGVSGSGKSSLAYDIVFAEGQRRYIDCLSPYARQFIKQLSHADVDRVSGVPPTVAISQKTAPPAGISTVATVTEIYQYLRLLYAKLGVQHCTKDNTPITSRSPESLVSEIERKFLGKRIFIFAPAVTGRKGYYNELFNRALSAEITEAKIDGAIVSLEPSLRLARHKLHWISLLVGSISNLQPNSIMLQQAVEQCLLLGNGDIEICEGNKRAEPELFSIARVCPKCGAGYRELDPQDFSFRSSRGVCPKCQGRGIVVKGGNLGEASPCPECKGARIGKIGRHVYLNAKTINELTALSPSQLKCLLGDFAWEKSVEQVSQPIMKELQGRLSMLESIGLDYLTLDRDASTLSGGEAQRLRLAKALGSPLTGICYILDEPSIGLHPQDHAQLMKTLFSLRDAGNTVLVVEHDEDTIRAADHIIDIGPGGGTHGGQIVAQGNLEDILNEKRSSTGMALRSRAMTQNSVKPRRWDKSSNEHQEWLSISGVKANNLRGFSLDLPLNAITVVCGVSGSGKSSLVHQTLVPAILEAFEGEKEREKFYRKTWDDISALGSLNRFVEIDQSPVGKTSASTPASYLGIFDQIRRVFAMLPEAKARGWDASFFSFNTGRGRCPDCNGKGEITIPMSFLPEARMVCESCGGGRYIDALQEAVYQGFSIADVLKKTMSGAREIFAHHEKIRRSLDYVLELGLGYLTLGQPTHTLSGGEAQRLKIARELGRRDAVSTIYILDEPTVGLHITDVDKLYEVLSKLVERGNTVVIIEHNLDIIRAADYLVELGPGPGERGGCLLFSGTPIELQASKLETPTKRALGKDIR